MNSDQLFTEPDVLSAGILVVDDEAANVRLMRKTLESAGYSNISVTQNPREVVAICRERTVDLVILDIRMPGMDGFQVIAELDQKLSARQTSVLVLTAQDRRELRIHALESGVRDFVTKPFDRTELLARVRNLLELQLAHRWMHTQNRRLEEMVRSRTGELQRTRLKVVHHLGRAAEYRDNETGLHIIRMSNMSVLVGREAGLSEYECELLLNASPMHDIGKIGIPDHILLKPGKLTASEWEIMKTHAQIGADILSGDESDLMRMAHDIALSHHEKWDGSGYPNSLRGEQIPLAARIVALADVFDALTSERPYKSAWPVEQAVELIVSERGRHFEPFLVECFSAVLPGILSIKERFAEPGTDSAAQAGQ